MCSQILCTFLSPFVLGSIVWNLIITFDFRCQCVIANLSSVRFILYNLKPESLLSNFYCVNLLDVKLKL